VADRKYVILCVDDENTPLTLRKLVLEKAGYSVIPASSAPQALTTLALHDVDLILTDLLMPEMSGADLAREAKRRKPGLPVVLLSGVNEIPPDASCADLFISKVEGPVVLCKKIEEILHKAENNHRHSATR
jgi:CheY-like chemotaxis protein